MSQSCLANVLWRRERARVGERGGEISVPFEGSDERHKTVFALAWEVCRLLGAPDRKSEGVISVLFDKSHRPPAVRKWTETKDFIFPTFTARQHSTAAASLGHKLGDGLNLECDQLFRFNPCNVWLNRYVCTTYDHRVMKVIIVLKPFALYPEGFYSKTTGLRLIFRYLDCPSNLKLPGSSWRPFFCLFCCPRLSKENKNPLSLWTTLLSRADSFKVKMTKADQQEAILTSLALYYPQKGPNVAEVCPLKWPVFPDQHLQQQILSQSWDCRRDLKSAVIWIEESSFCVLIKT